MARRVAWFQSPEATLRDPVLLLNQAMNYGPAADLRVVRSHFGDEDLREALRRAYPGIFSARSWSYWRLMLDMGVPPPRPARRLPGVGETTTAPWR